MFNSPNDMQWRAELDPLHRSNNQTYIGEIIDAHGDANYTDTLSQTWSVKILGWGTEIYSCKAIVPHGAYNGSGEYNTYKKGDVVILIAREGQLEELMIMGSVRLNGDVRKLQSQGQALKPGEMPIGASGNSVSSNQVSIHPARVTKLNSYTQIYGANNIQEVYADPAIGGTLEERASKQPLPGVVKTINAEGVYTLYAYGGIVNYTDGNLVFISNGSKQNKCTKFLEQAKRHLEIAQQLKSLASLKLELNGSLQEDLDLDIDNDNRDLVEISDNTSLLDPITGRASVDKNINIEADEKLVSPSLVNIEGLNIDKNKLKGEELRSSSYRAKKHEELAALAKETAEDCNRNFSAYHQQADLMSQSVGNHFGTGGEESAVTSSVEPSQYFGNVDSANYATRSSGSNAPVKPPVTLSPADPTENYDSKMTSGPHLPIKRIFLHNTAADLASTIATFKDPKSEVSAHYTIDRDGKIYQHVPDDKRAYHATKAGNANSIGIEHVATRQERGITSAQEKSSIALIKYLVAAYSVDKNKIAGHRTVYATECPGLIWKTEPELRAWVNKNI